MSLKRHKRLSSKKKKSPKDNLQAEVLHELGLEAYQTIPLDVSSMLDIITWTLGNQSPLEPSDLPKAFLQCLWLLRQDARTPWCESLHNLVTNDDNNSTGKVLSSFKGDSQGAINPLDLVTAVYMSASTFLQQEISKRMVQCQFSIPLVLPNKDPEEPSCFLLWPLRGIVGQWRSHPLNNDRRIQEGDLATTCMPLVSFVRLGCCSVSKSQVLNHMLRGVTSSCQTFLHRGMEGGQLPKRLSSGLLEIGWHLPTGDSTKDVFPVPLVFSNLRGDASAHKKCLTFLCKASSAIVVFCGNLKEKEKLLLASCKDTNSKLILIDLLDTERNESRVVGFVDENLEKYMGLPEESVIQGRGLSEDALASKLCDTLKHLLPDRLKLITLEEAAQFAADIGLNVDEGPICQKAMASVEEVLKGLDEGSDEYRRKQLPLQGPLWSKLAELEKAESKQRKERTEIDPQLQKEKNDIMAELRSYKMTPAMKIFTDVLFTKDKVKRAYFLSWLTLRLKKTTKQNKTQDLLTNLQTVKKDSMLVDLDKLEQRLTLTTDNSGKQQMSLDDCADPSYEPDTCALGPEHFLREIGLIFELAHISPSSGSQNVLRLPSLATDLLLYGIPLELMDGDASNIPIQWLGCVFGELKRRLPQEQCRTRVLTNLGDYNARNAEILSALFGVKFPEWKKQTSRGVYMVALCLPENLRKDMKCDVLLLIEVRGLCSVSLDSKRNILGNDNEMATFATGLSDFLLHSMSSHLGSDFETNLSVRVNALLRIKEYGSMPFCQFFVQNENVNSKLQASQLRYVSQLLLQTSNIDKDGNTTSCTVSVKGPWNKMSLSEPVDTDYSGDVLKFKEILFEALKRSAAKAEAPVLPEFMRRLYSVWDAIKEESFSIGLQNTDIALAFSLLCTEFFYWENNLLDNMKSWLTGATKKNFTTKGEALDASIQNDLLSELKKEASEEVEAEVNKFRSIAETYVMKEETLKMRSDKFMPILMSNIDNLQDRVTDEITERLEAVYESHYSSTQLKKFKALLGKEQESKVDSLVEKSKTTKILLQDTEIEDEFEAVWGKILSNFEFRPSETEDITPRVDDILRQNLISRGLQKHMKKLEMIGQNQNSDFQVCDEHFGYRSRLKQMFEDNNKQHKVEAQQVANNIIEECKQYIADKCNKPADFSDGYITELLQNIEKSLNEKSVETRSAFEVDLKVYLCNASCQDFQNLHNRYAKDAELLTCITKRKSMDLAEFIYDFRKRDQCQRVAQEFISMVIKPTVLDYINRPLGISIAEEIQRKAQQYHSSQAFHQSLLEEMIKEDQFEVFLEYLLFYDNFRLRKIQKTVTAHLTESTNLGQWRHQRLCEIVGKIEEAVNESTEGISGVLNDTKPLLERVCLTLEKGDVNVIRTCLTGPLFSITVEWNRFAKCLLESVAAMQMDLDQEFSKNVDATQFLNCLPVQPQDYLFKKVKGCDKQCPLCRAPCEEEDMGHEAHNALLHRPKGMQPYASSSISCISCPESMSEDKDTHDISTTRNVLHSLYPDWSFSPDNPNSTKASDYWRYVLVKFNERFAQEFKREPTKIPEEWRRITQEQALKSLKEVFLTRTSV
ncbi:up-regulator of cell proliferation [Neolamprologus brichardi]|uniref:up-regulator of cell proliferation n=1 Tax=Neolamprologus brichardi TaxID=32507 RepID=UPI0016437A91|nr:up-regulator of cell proliferation [Neolamprologus brichardi]